MRSDELRNLSSQNAAFPSEADSALARKLMEQLDTRGPLPPSPRLKCRRTGILYIWTAGLAELGEDAFINCDEAGNEDPAAWQGRYPKGMNVEFRGVAPPETPAAPPREVSTLRPPEAEPPVARDEAPGPDPEGALGGRAGRKGRRVKTPNYDQVLGLPPGQAAALGVEPIPAIPPLDDFEAALAAAEDLEEKLRHAAQ